jgi:glycosyltransferase involved in cell wall biosynthesis
LISVIVPAHDEERVIRRCLEAMTTGARPGELEIIVVCNGCSDGTAKVAGEFGEPVRVIESPIPSKRQALNLGERSARAFPRFYVDADVVLPIESIRAVAAALEDGPFLAAAPRMQVDLRHRGWAVRAYYDIWTRLPYVSEGIIGSGVYALSESGRARFDRFPEITSDDGFVRLLFAPEERITVDGSHFLVTPPRSLRGILNIKTRSQKGCVELRHAYPALERNERRNYGRVLGEIARRPQLWPKLVLYGGVLLATRLNAQWKYRIRGLADWERDDESR